MCRRSSDGIGVKNRQSVGQYDLEREKNNFSLCDITILLSNLFIDFPLFVSNNSFCLCVVIFKNKSS